MITVRYLTIYFPRPRHLPFVQSPGWIGLSPGHDPPPTTSPARPPPGDTAAHHHPIYHLSNKSRHRPASLLLPGTSTPARARPDQPGGPPARQASAAAILQHRPPDYHHRHPDRLDHHLSSGTYPIISCQSTTTTTYQSIRHPDNRQVNNNNQIATTIISTITRARNWHLVPAYLGARARAARITWPTPINYRHTSSTWARNHRPGTIAVASLLARQSTTGA